LVYLDLDDLKVNSLVDAFIFIRCVVGLSISLLISNISQSLTFLIYYLALAGAMPAPPKAASAIAR